MKRFILSVALLCLSISVSSVAQASSVTPQLIKKIEQHNPTLSHAALMSGVRAYEHLKHQGLTHKPWLTIVDFSRASSKKRLWVINMKNGDTPFFTYVAQGTKTGLNMAHYFSNRIDSHASSIGVYLTGRPYYGTVGYSMRLIGLDNGFNTNVFQRDVVMHTAWHISKQFIDAYGHIGHTWGCFGLSKRIANQIINTINSGSVMVAYYPNQTWLSTSPYEQPLT